MMREQSHSNSMLASVTRSRERRSESSQEHLVTYHSAFPGARLIIVISARACEDVSMSESW
eukprot:2163984-Rhodomonas_salina.3